MLPDFPKLKQDIENKLLIFLRSRINFYLGHLSEAPTVSLPEGDQSALVRENEEKESTEFATASEDITIAREDLPKMTLDKIILKIDEAAKSIAKQQAEYAYKTINEALDKIGNVVHSKDKTINAELILESFRKVQIDFDANGLPHMPAIHCHPDLAKTFEAINTEFENNPNLQKELKTIIETKRGEWRAREASRKLVG